jgi:hypothetical protein
MVTYRPQITSWSLRRVYVLGAVRGEYRACRWTDDFLLVSDRDVVIHSLTENIGQFKHCNSLVQMGGGEGDTTRNVFYL